MWVVETKSEARRKRRNLRGRIAFVPTMGALHAGHRALFGLAAEHADHVLVSIFVNPTQFGPNEDYQAYPRGLESDLQACREDGVAGVLAPSVPEMYPPGRLPARIEVPDLARDLEGAHRPGHFAGVCRVVAKLFHVIEPDLAVFGDKDYQQLKIVEAMVADLEMPVEILAGPTVRDADGLAVSSRNARLSTAGRSVARGLPEALARGRAAIGEAGETDPGVVEAEMERHMRDRGVTPDYAAIRDPATLAPLETLAPFPEAGVVALVAGHVEGVRLIDHAPIADAAGS